MNSVSEKNRESFSELALSLGEEKAIFEARAHETLLIGEILRDLRPGGLVTDIGCFTGLTTEVYRNAVDSAVVIGADISREALRLAQRRGLEVFQADFSAKHLPIRDGTSTVTVACQVIEHVVDTDHFVEELKRITTRDGWIIIGTPNASYWKSRLAFALGNLPYAHPGVSSYTQADPRVDQKHIRIGNVPEWSGLFRMHGLKVMNVIGTERSHRPGVLEQFVNFIGQILSRRPTLAASLVFVLQRRDNRLDREAASNDGSQKRGWTP